MQAGVSFSNVTEKLHHKRMTSAIEDLKNNHAESVNRLQEELIDSKLESASHHKRAISRQRANRNLSSISKKQKLELLRLQVENEELVTVKDFVENERDDEAANSNRLLRLRATAQVAQGMGRKRYRAAESKIVLLQEKLDHGFATVHMMKSKWSLEKIQNEATHAAVLKKIKADMGQLCDSKEALEARVAEFEVLHLRAESRGRPYVAWVRMMYIELIGHGVSSHSCSKVVKTVFDNLPFSTPSINLDDLPNRPTVDNLRLEGGIIAKMHVCVEIEDHKWEGAVLYTDEGAFSQPQPDPNLTPPPTITNYNILKSFN